MTEATKKCSVCGVKLTAINTCEERYEDKDWCDDCGEAYVKHKAKNARMKATNEGTTVSTQTKADGTTKLNQVQYVRQQKGHSIIIWGFMCCFMIGIPFVIYYTKSPNHYWHA